MARISKIIALVALITLPLSVSFTLTALGEESVKDRGRTVWFAAGFESATVPDVEGHTIYFIKGKGISFSEKWGPALTTVSGISDVVKGAGTVQGYVHSTYPDGSTTTLKYKGEQMAVGPGITGGVGGEVTYTYVKGTGKFAGIKGGGTSKFSILGPGQWYDEFESQYTLP